MFWIWNQNIYHESKHIAMLNLKKLEPELELDKEDVPMQGIDNENKSYRYRN